MTHIIKKILTITLLSTSIATNSDINGVTTRSQDKNRKKQAILEGVQQLTIFMNSVTEEVDTHRNIGPEVYTMLRQQMMEAISPELRRCIMPIIREDLLPFLAESYGSFIKDFGAIIVEMKDQEKPFAYLDSQIDRLLTGFTQTQGIVEIQRKYNLPREVLEILTQSTYTAFKKLILGHSEIIQIAAPILLADYNETENPSTQEA